MRSCRRRGNRGRGLICNTSTYYAQYAPPLPRHPRYVARSSSTFYPNLEQSAVPVAYDNWLENTASPTRPCDLRWLFKVSRFSLIQLFLKAVCSTPGATRNLQDLRSSTAILGNIVLRSAITILSVIHGSFLQRSPSGLGY